MTCKKSNFKIKTKDYVSFHVEILQADFCIIVNICIMEKLFLAQIFFFFSFMIATFFYKIEARIDIDDDAIKNILLTLKLTTAIFSLTRISLLKPNTNFKMSI